MMLEAVFGNKSVERILIFLSVNGKCYGTELHRALKVPLTPLQKALIRLEKGGLITSYNEGKTKLYKFNQAYPLMKELEELLKKAYTLLPAFEKKHYYIQRVSNSQILSTFWEKLKMVSRLTFSAKSKLKESSGWNGKGQGEVHIVKDGPNKLTFNEKGTWQGKSSQIDFSNVFRWTLDLEKEVISLEHLRRGPDLPVFLFHLAPTGKNSLSSVDSHLCGGDTYFGQIHFDLFRLRLNWRVIGPKKNEEIDYFYS